uniref:alpha-1,3-mannosyl-glycoprotein 2-beta-N-acetylglucosaminyltransferase n=1 Tax=Pseudo-nitzschia australis TaxID=44445 RepID=A0A7S4EHE9_9STRA|mmetsp:Transcript_15567/g.31872  ORF Transcript_15567/g.31872 Transcript_15567/m.31872 type:complete len:479 (+) Transcript_15567:118-1554(+)
MYSRRKDNIRPIMAVISRRRNDLEANIRSDRDATAVHDRETATANQRKTRYRGTWVESLTSRLRWWRVRPRGYEADIIKGLLALVVLCIMVVFAVYSGYFGSSMRIYMNTNVPTGSQEITPNSNANNGYESPLLIITYNRPEYLSRTLAHVLETIPQPCGFGCPVVVSEDGNLESNKKLLLSFKQKFEAKGIPLIHIHHENKKIGLKGGKVNAYVELAKHIGWALSQVFDGTLVSLDSQQKQHPLPQRLMLLEEDIEVAPDFFSYMESTSTLLDNDPTLFAVSAFNDNGHLENGDPKRLLRSDFFPGLGWMMTRNLWKNELQSKWPNGYWDDWLRDPKQRKNRQVIRPEVSRTYHFGTNGGASKNQFGSILERVRLNEQAIRWDLEDLSYLENSKYENQYTKLVTSSKLVNTIAEANRELAEYNVRIEYDNLSDFTRLADSLGIMNDEKASVPRTAYRGVVEARLGSTRLFLTPMGGI